MEMVSLLGILGFLSIEDIRRRSVRIVWLALAAIAGLLLHMHFERISIWNVLGGIGIGLVMYGISVLSHERIGKGDALILAVTGIFLGFWDNLILLWIAALLAAAAGGIIVLLFHKGRNFELPFIPCIFFGFIIYLGTIYHA